METKRDFLERRRAALISERSTFIPHWKELSEFIQPRRGRFLASDVNKGNARHKSIINSAATTAHRRCRSGIMSGLMSPSRPWSKYGVADDPQLSEFGPVAQWLYQLEQTEDRIFRQSNLYSMTPTMIGEMILFGTGCMTHVDDFKDVARFYTRTAGSYLIDLDARLEVSTLILELEWTVGQIVEEYGLENCSQAVKGRYDTGDYGVRYPLVQYVGPNAHTNKNSPYAKDKAFTSCHYEPGTSGNERGKYLRESGFDEFPAYCPRWDVTGEDVYGTDCPGMTALGDTKGLQLKEKRKAQGIDKMVNPPLGGPAEVKSLAVSSLPGALTAYSGGTQKLEPLYQVQLPIQEMRQDIDADERRIKEAHYNDLFRAISDLEGVQPQNELFLTQVNQERLLELGPMMERFQGEFQDKLHERTFNQIMRAGIMPPPPEELRGRPLKLEYIGPMAMAARAVATSAIDRVAGFAGGLMKMGFMDARFKFNAQQSIDEYAKALGAPPGIVVPDDEAAAAQQAEMEQQQAAMLAEGAQMASGAVKNMADAGSKMQQGAPR